MLWTISIIIIFAINPVMGICLLLVVFIIKMKSSIIKEFAKDFISDQVKDYFN